MSNLPESILHRIGNTSLIPLRHITPANGARILLKLENENPTGSMKDRMALAMIETAEADGRLAAGGTVVEYSTGSTGVAPLSSAPSRAIRCTSFPPTHSRRRSVTICGFSAPGCRSSRARADA